MRDASSTFALRLVIVCAALLRAGSCCAQGDLFTEGPGVNPPFEDIRDSIGSVSGYPGTLIDVDNDAVEGGLFGEFSIENDLRLHTLANSSVPQGGHDNWSRWYQTDGATQVFRLFEGEENIRNSSPQRARIEAFDANTAWNFEDNEWHEWAGRYTIVDPIGAAIFQVKDLDDDWAMQLNMSVDGRVRVQHRRPLEGQPKFETLVENAIGQPFDVRIRDNGRDYEVYLGEATQPFTTGRYLRNTEPGDDTNTRFRWGMYVGASDVHRDGMIFVSHASVDPILGGVGVPPIDFDPGGEYASQFSSSPYTEAFGAGLSGSIGVALSHDVVSTHDGSLSVPFTISSDGDAITVGAFVSFDSFGNVDDAQALRLGVTKGGSDDFAQLPFASLNVVDASEGVLAFEERSGVAGTSSDDSEFSLDADKWYYFEATFTYNQAGDDALYDVRIARASDSGEIGSVLHEWSIAAGQSNNEFTAGATLYGAFKGHEAFETSGSGGGAVIDGFYVSSDGVSQVPDILAGDFNSDGVVNAADYTVWRDNFGATGESSLGGAGDFSGVVDEGDLALWAASYSASLGAASAVPEPSGWLLLTLAAPLAISARCWRVRSAEHSVTSWRGAR